MFPAIGIDHFADLTAQLGTQARHQVLTLRSQGSMSGKLPGRHGAPGSVIESWGCRPSKRVDLALDMYAEHASVSHCLKELVDRSVC